MHGPTNRSLYSPKLLINSATVIGDFGAGTFELTFDSGGESQCLSISIVNDNLIENNEIFGVLVVTDGDSNPMVFPGSIPFASVTIIDTTGLCMCVCVCVCMCVCMCVYVRCEVLKGYFLNCSTNRDRAGHLRGWGGRWESGGVCGG